jgi:hypothetical protein
MYIDSTGRFPWLILIILVSATITGAVFGATSNSRLFGEKKGIHDSEEKLTIGERVGNAIVGALIGLAAGALVLSVAGAMGSVIVGSATTPILIFGMTGLQTFAWGALIYDVLALIAFPIIGIELPLIEYEEK